jgi:antitoxin PrlF
MKNETVVTSKGQVTIPKHIRERRKIPAGTRLEVTEQGDDEIVLRRAKRTRKKSADRDVEFEEYLERVRGTMNLGMTTDEFMELLRGE